MIPRNAWPYTHRDVVQKHFAHYDDSISKGEYQPLVYPFLTLGATIVIVYLLIPHQNRPWLRHARFAVFAANLANALYTIKHCRARDVAAAMGVGLISAWSVIWTGAILLCNDAQRDFWRIERVGGVFGSTVNDKRRKNVHEKQAVNEKVEKEGNAKRKNRSNGNAHASESEEALGPSQRHGEFAWQSFPIHPFIERLDWVLDLLCNFRGAGWNWRTISTSPPPKSVQLEVLRNTRHPPPNHAFKKHFSQTHVYPTRRALLINNAKTLLMGYVFLDLLKSIVLHDPYFWGIIDSQPAPYLPFSTVLANNPILLRMVRLLISQFGIMWALKTIFSLSPLFFSGLLGPSRLGARAEPWIYPETWGSYENVLDKGLAGWWGGWWHQTFRFGFEQPSRKIIELTGINPKSPRAKLVQLGLAFVLSGILHASGSYTCHGETNPLQGPLAFFSLQAIAIFVEAFLRPALVNSGLPQWLKRCLTFVYVHVWFYHTAGLVCDDFARGGMWLFEPLPVSIFRGPLGLGTQGDSWWCWNGSGVRWHRAERWWMSGIAF